MNADRTDGPTLMVSLESCEPGSWGVGVHLLGAGAMILLASYVQAGGLLQSILRITVAQLGEPPDDTVPDVSGRYRLLDDGIWFEPHLPFEKDLPYRARFDPRSLGDSELTEVLTLQFSRVGEHSALPPEVEHVFPAGDVLPENLLRFYVCFTSPMQRGRAGTEIALLGPDNEPASDVLYRAPVELWDRSMRCLTVLLDPGRLKRGVGPNRELGSPLKVGQMYTLEVGGGMTDLSGSQLGRTVYKRFQVTDAVRMPIEVGQWKVIAPVTDTRQPLTLMFPRPLDWALLSSTITITSPRGHLIEGRIAIDQCEMRWRFTPTLPWAAGSYHVSIASSLEDVCGNDVVAAFDRPLRSEGDLAREIAASSIFFDLQ